jgi:AcrR family transcriptional regulator
VSVSAGSQRRPRKDAERNRRRLLEAAREAFAAQGLDVGVDEIARRAGVGMGTLYRHFATKTALIDAIVNERFDELADIAREAVTDEDPWRGFSHFMIAGVELQVGDRGFKDALSGRIPAESAIGDARRRLEPCVRALIERAQKSGDLRPDLQFEDVAVLFWATARIVESTGDIAPEHWRRFLSLSLDGLRPSAATKPPAPPLTHAQYRNAMDRWAAWRGGVRRF